MAIMIPDTPPSARHANPSENQFWNELKLQLSDDFYVYHSLPYLTADSNQGEVDFLILHRKYGLLNIECKGHGVERDEQGQWYRTNQFGRRTRLNRSPMEQATAQMRAIVDGLRDPLKRALDAPFGSFPVLYGWALVFPFSQREHLNLPLELRPEVLIDATDITRDLQAKIQEIYSFHFRKLERPPRQLSPEQFARLRAVVSPPVRIEMTRAGQIGLDKKAMLRLSKEQAGGVEAVMNNRRLRVQGGAGTGKTVMAMHAAKLWAQQGKAVLITCFNSKLAEYLARSVQGWSQLKGTVDVHHFHNLCARAGEDIGGLTYPAADAPGPVQAEFWNETAPFALVEALDAGVFSQGPWDAIIVDEAQDFLPTWWEILEACLRDTSSTMAIFYDEGQNIFEKHTEIPDWGMNYRLTTNFRNSKEILRAIQPLCPSELRSHRDCVDGIRPSVYKQRSASKTREQVGQLLRDLVERDGMKSRQIAILTPRSPANSSLDGMRELGGVPLVHEVDAWSEGVLHSSISGFKGLEADVVILVDIDPRDPRCSASARYVAASRAKHLLHIFEKGNWLAVS